MINGDRLRQIDSSFLLTLVFTKEKGGIHAINRSIMDAFGYYRVTGLLQKISAGFQVRGHPPRRMAFLCLSNRILTPGIVLNDAYSSPVHLLYQIDPPQNSIFHLLIYIPPHYYRWS